MRRIVQIVTFGNGISRIVVSEIEAGDRAGTQLYMRSQPIKGGIPSSHAIQLQPKPP